MILKCKMCGGDLAVQEGASICACEYCGTIQTVPNLDSEKKAQLFAWADDLRKAARFDEAARAYETIALEFPEEAEAYWGLVLCRYGIEYVEDPQTRRRVPTCHRSSLVRVQDDKNYQAAVARADAISRRVYEEEATVIEAVRAAIVASAGQYVSYDVFICYKESDSAGNRTQDSVLAQEIYEALSKEGLRVFFARITLEDKLGSEYEPIIYGAIHSAPVMLVIGTQADYFEEVWVRNEWTRFLGLMEVGERKTLIPCYKDIEPSSMPPQLAQLQSQDMGKLGFVQDLVRGVLKLLGRKQPMPAASPEGPATLGPSSLTRRGILALEDGEYRRANSFFERALDENASDGYAYLGKFLAKRRVSTLACFKEEIAPYDDKDFQRALRFADEDLSQKLQEALRINEQNVQKKRRAEEEKERRKQEALNRQRAIEEAERQHAAACEQVEAAVQAELSPWAAEIDRRYEPALSALRNEMGAAESSVLQERVRLQMEVSHLEREQAALGAFAWAKRREYAERIAILNGRIKSLPSGEQVREGYLPRITELTNQRDAEKAAMEAQIRIRHPFPNLEEFKRRLLS